MANAIVAVVAISNPIESSPAAAVGGYFLYRWIKHRRVIDKIASTT
jgi:hypothetical protein